MSGGGVPPRLERSAALAWRYLVVLAAVYVTFLAVARVKVVLIPALLALFVSSVLAPAVQWLKRRGWRPALAVWGVVLAIIPLIAVVVALIVPSIANSVGPLSEALSKASDRMTAWLSSGPLGLSKAEIQNYLDQAIEQIKAHAGDITSGVLGGAVAAIEVITAIALTALATFFYLKDGDLFVKGLLGRVRNRSRIEGAMTAAWRTLSSYVRGLAMVGVVDSVLIGIGLLAVGTPLVVPLMLLVFVGAFFPVVGAFTSGLLAVAVTFANGGFVDAAVILAVVVAVQQIEGHVLLPFIFGRTLELHSLVIVLAIAIGGTAFGLVGAFFAVPLTAVFVAVHQAVAADPDASVISLLGSGPYASPHGRLPDPSEASADSGEAGEPGSVER